MFGYRNPSNGLALLQLAVCCLALALEGSAHATEYKLPYVNQFYPDFGFAPSPKCYKGNVFVLSQKYPTAEPDASEMPPFLSIDYKAKTAWRKYLIAAREYCFQGNIQ